MKREMPGWAIPVVIVLGVALLVWIGYRAFTGYNVAPNPPAVVHKGELNFQKEAAQGHVGQQVVWPKGTH